MGRPGKVFWQLTRYGNRGVDFFFVLSGFIILYAHFGDIDRPKAFGAYLRRRFVRLYPIYWLYTAVFVAILALVGGTDSQLPRTMGEWLTSLTLIRFTPGAPPLPVAWTLFHEVAFYALFSILILNRRLGVAAFALMSVIALALFHFPPENARTPFSVYTAVYNIYFLFGMLAFWLYRRGGRGIWELTLGLAMTAISFATEPPLRRLLLVLGLSLTVAGITKMETVRLIVVPSALSLIGDASYTIYLTHVNVLGALLKVAMRLHVPSVIGPGPTFFIVLISEVALGCAAYLLVEKPLLAALRDWRNRPAAAVVAT